MKDKTKIPSRRALLHMGVRSLAGAGVLGTLGQGASAASDNRALVCIYLFGGEGGSNLPNVTELKDLHRKQVLAVARNVAPPVQSHSAVSTPGQFMAQKYQALRFLPNGFATLEWAARKAGSSSHALSIRVSVGWASPTRPKRRPKYSCGTMHASA